jgi:putative ABC transport system substrate-binding protein
MAILKPFKAAAASHSMEAIEAPVRDVSNLEVVIATQAREPNRNYRNAG